VYLEKMLVTHKFLGHTFFFFFFFGYVTKCRSPNVDYQKMCICKKCYLQGAFFRTILENRRKGAGRFLKGAAKNIWEKAKAAKPPQKAMKKKNLDPD